jgi:ABC-2 type transport system ATP-binding protein
VKDPLVSIRHLSKAFGQQLVLDNINATIPKGEMVGLAGPDGAGKTTLIRLMAGLLLPTQGEIKVAGYDTIQEAEGVHQHIGYMPQRFGLYEDLTVLQNLVLYADLKGVVGLERELVFKRLLAFTDLAPFVDRLAGALSGGMKQKLGLACTLLRTPTLLLLDEPSVGVDPISRRELWKMVQQLLVEGISVVWSTAYLDEAERCQTVLLLNEGKMLYQGPPQELAQRVDHRTFKIISISGNRRAVLMKALNQDNITDVTLQGSDVRLVTREPSPIDLAPLHAGPQAELHPTPPRFEDAFIDILGGIPKGTSALAEQSPTIVTGPQSIIEAQGLTKRFGSFTAVDEITFNVQRGEIFGLLGPNGAGKSTTFKMLCGLLKPTSGKAYVNGLDLQKAPGEARAHLGYMAQKFSLYGDLSVQQNLDFFAGVYNLSGYRRHEAIDQMIEIFKFAPYLNDSAKTLPLGYKQRLALSCAVMHRPEVLFLDEPTSGVDPITRREFWNHMNGLVEKGFTILVTTHFMDEAEYCDRIGLIYQSQLMTIGSPDSLKEQVRSSEHPSPTLEDAFISLIERYEQNYG